MKPKHGVEYDPFLLEVLQKGFETIAETMALILMRTAVSSIVRESMDFSTAICDAKGQTLAQGVTTPVHLGSFYDAMVALIGQYQGKIADGDVFIFNDPYTAASQHLPDIYIVKPVFVGHELVGWGTTIAHHTDVGGIVPGSNSLNATEICQEGLRLPIVKLYEAGKPNQSVWDIIATNVRTPKQVLGDLHAQIASATTGERELQALIERFGIEIFRDYGQYLQDYAERLARAEFSEIPDGTYCFDDHIDGLGDNPQPVPLHVTVTVSGNHVTVDWTGSSQQVPFGINCSMPFTKACAYTALRSIMREEVPNCFGYTRAITVKAETGSVMNPLAPAPCGARGVTGYRMIDCLFGALAQAVPDRIAADGSGGSTLPTLSGYHDGQRFVFCEVVMGNWGATLTGDGQDGVPHMGANSANVPVEMIEAEFPIRIAHYGLQSDTGGPGRFRGGLSVRREYQVLCDQIELNVRSDKHIHPPHGLFGGQAGSPARNIVESGSESRQLPALLENPIILNKNDLFRHFMAGGGGYGNPLDRDVELVLRDVVDERISLTHAAAQYGVIVEGDPPRIDLEATKRLRERQGKEGRHES